MRHPFALNPGTTASRLVVPDTETGRLFLSTDWSRTPLGPVGDWPESLRVAVGICLNSRFPMFVWWGEELVNIYNDSYLPVLGRKHPAAFGRPARPTWPEIWDVVGPQAERVMGAGEATWNERVLLVMERNGYPESTWFTWSYSPIPDGRGGIGGVFCACYEDTPQVVAERERDLLHDEVELERRRLAEAFAQSPAFLAVLREPSHTFASANERYYELIGRRDIVGRTVREVLPDIEGQGFFEKLDEAYASGIPFVGSGMPVVFRREGLVRKAYVDFVFQPLRGPEGKVGGILVHGVDVTETRAADLRGRFLLALDEAVRPLTEPAEITATCARLLGEHLEADRCAYADVEEDEDTFNLTGDYSRGVASIVGRYRFAQFGDEVLRLMRADQPFVVSDVDAHQPPLGDLSAYRATQIQAVICVPLHKDGRFVAAMAVHQKTPRTWRLEEVDLVRTVASRCWESIERARVARTLVQSEAAFRHLADAMPQIVFAAQPDGHVDYFNRQWSEYTGLPEEVVGFEAWKQVHTAEGLPRTVERWAHAVRTGEPYEIEYELRRRDGEYRWHLARALPIRDPAGRILRWVGTNTDIHERKQFEESLQAARSDAERASRMKDEFLATLSHELRTPLNAILGWAQILRIKAELPPDLAKGVEVIERNARAQGTIIEDLLDMSAIISGKVRLDVQRADLAEIVRAAVEAARPAATAKGLELAVRVPERAPLSGDANRLQQVLWNLLSNAVKFTPANGKVEVALRREGDGYEVRVSDTGEGVAADFLPFIFDRFRQADATKSRRHGGLGLGLSIVKQLVELHGGTVSARSAGPGRGAAFAVWLPEAQALPDAAHAGPPARGAAAAHPFVPSAEPPKLDGLEVLVVDDDRDARDLVKRLLEEGHARVTTAQSALEAAAQLERHRFDVLVSDIGMPGEDGYSLLRRVRALPALRGGNVPAVALSAYARAEDRAQARRAGFQRHLAKPVDPAELLSVVASLGGRG